MIKKLILYLTQVIINRPFFYCTWGMIVHCTACASLLPARCCCLIAGDGAAAADDLPDAKPGVNLRREERSSTHLVRVKKKKQEESGRASGERIDWISMDTGIGIGCVGWFVEGMWKKMQGRGGRQRKKKENRQPGGESASPRTYLSHRELHAIGPLFLNHLNLSLRRLDHGGKPAHAQHNATHDEKREGEGKKTFNIIATSYFFLLQSHHKVI